MADRSKMTTIKMVSAFLRLLYCGLWAMCGLSLPSIQFPVMFTDCNGGGGNLLHIILLLVWKIRGLPGLIPQNYKIIGYFQP